MPRLISLRCAVAAALVLGWTAPVLAVPAHVTGTYFGGGEWDEFVAVAFAADGTIVAAGNTESGGPVAGMAPTVIGTDGPTPTATGFVARFSNDGRTLLSYTRFAWGMCEIDDLAVDATGIYVIGFATADYAPLIGGLGGIDTSPPASGSKPFIAKLSPDGSTLIAGTYLAGYDTDRDELGIDFMSDGDVAAIHDNGGGDYLSRLSNDLGVRRWRVAYNTQAGSCRSQGLAVSRSDDMIYVIGYGMGNTTNEPLKGPFAYQFDGDGNQGWVRAWDGKHSIYNFNPKDGDGRLYGLVADSTGEAAAIDASGNPLFTAFSDGGNSVLTKDPNDWRNDCPNMDGDGTWGFSGASSWSIQARLDKTTHQWIRSNKVVARRWGLDNMVQASRVKAILAMSNQKVLVTGWGGDFFPILDAWYPNTGGAFIMKSELGAAATVREFSTTIPNTRDLVDAARCGSTNRYAMVGTSTADGAPVPGGLQTTFGGVRDGYLIVMDDDESSPENQLPTVAITYPEDGGNLAEDQDITITADASDPDGTVVKVEFYADGDKLGEDVAAPYAYLWPSVPRATYVLRARAIDDDDAGAWSDPVTIRVGPPNVPPAVAITQPEEGATFTEPADVLIVADASDPDGTVANVEFYRGDNKLGEDDTAPYEYLWIGGHSGNHTFTAVATDDEGAETTSDPVTITVNPLSGQVYCRINFQPSGKPIPLGYLPDYGDAYGVRAGGYSYGWNATNTANARDRDNPASIDQRYDTLNHMQKDGTFTWEIGAPNGAYTVYLVMGDPSYIDHINTVSVEGTVLTDPDGEDDYDAYVTTVTVNDGRLTVSPAAGASNAKICFIHVYIPNEPPAVSITAPADGVIVAEGSDLLIAADASDADGTVEAVEFFYDGGNSLGVDGAAPWEVTWSGVPRPASPVTVYSLTAVATDDQGESTTSDPVTVTVAVAGDTDLDGDVDATDLATLGMNWAPSATDKEGAAGDTDGDGDVDATDLAALGVNWNPSGGGTAPAAAGAEGAVAGGAVAGGAGDAPRLVATSPTPGSATAGMRRIVLTFDRAVCLGGGAIEVHGRAGGTASGYAVAVVGTGETVEVTWPAPLAADVYEVRVMADAVLGADGGAALDGEVGDPADPSSLPSGDGVPGGDAHLEFQAE